MCYSAMVAQSVKALGIRFQARIQLDLFEELFRRRLYDDRIRIPRSMEYDFLEPTNEAEQRIQQAILEYRRAQAETWAKELTKQRERLSAAERSLAARSTKKAVNEQRIASNKIAWYESKLADLTRDQAQPDDTRIFPQWYAPVVVVAGGEAVVRPMRYHLRPGDKSSDIDRRFDGLYNARIDSLTGFWRNQFGRQHAVMVVSSFFENVARHAYEHRPLVGGESEQNLVVQFQPTQQSGARQSCAAEIQPAASPSMIVACLWDHWRARGGEPDLWSFAAVTDEPPADVSEAGHDRCIVALRDGDVARWLTPEGRSDEELFRLLADHEPFRYKHRLAG
ncbi:MAG TPA: SOS response-associated peptidase family protein [Polyangiaceae bacterium]